MHLVSFSLHESKLRLQKRTLILQRSYKHGRSGYYGEDPGKGDFQYFMASSQDQSPSHSSVEWVAGKLLYRRQGARGVKLPTGLE